MHFHLVAQVGCGSKVGIDPTKNNPLRAFGSARAGGVAPDKSTPCGPWLPTYPDPCGLWGVSEFREAISAMISRTYNGMKEGLQMLGLPAGSSASSRLEYLSFGKGEWGGSGHKLLAD